jgi:hypothetical protein
MQFRWRWLYTKQFQRVRDENVVGRSLTPGEKGVPLLLTLTSRWTTEKKQVLGKGDALMYAGFVARSVTLCRHDETLL